MLPIFLKTLPFFAIIGIGWMAARMRFFSAEATAWLTHFVFWFALSAMLFRLAANLSLAEIWNPWLAIAWTGAGATLFAGQFILSRLRGTSTAEATIEAQCGVIGNTGFMGLPMLALLLGPASAAPMLLILALDMLVFSTVVTLLITASRGNGLGNWWKTLVTLGKGILGNPMIVSTVAGFAWSGFGLPVPAALDETLALLGNAATPCALFAIGASLAGRSAERLAVAGWLSFVKLILHPALAAFIALVLLPVDTNAARVMIAAAALPVAGNIYILAQHYGVAPQRVSASILISTAVSIVTLPLVIAWAGGL